MVQQVELVIKKGILRIVILVQVGIVNLVQMAILLKPLRHVVQADVVQLLVNVISVVIVVINTPVAEPAIVEVVAPHVVGNILLERVVVVMSGKMVLVWQNRVVLLV